MIKKRFVTPRGYQLLHEGRREMVIRANYEADLRRQGLLSPAALWGKTHGPGPVRGRGEVLIMPGGQAIRQYRHGGLLRRLTGDRFLFGDRPLQEVVVTEAIKSAGIPTLEILAAIRDRGWGGWYRGYLITRFLPTAHDLITFLDRCQDHRKRQTVIKQAAAAVKTMHGRGIYHADLHLKNFLVKEGKKEVTVYLIDFDKSTITPHMSPARRIKNLARLDRSAEKLKRQGLRVTSKDKEIFCHAYATGDPEIQDALKTFVARYQWYTVLYRAGWWIAKIFYPRHNPWKKSTT
jgi:tRNA A-37 threonylcarbamoyl transferase component Bud32